MTTQSLFVQIESNVLYCNRLCVSFFRILYFVIVASRGFVFILFCDFSCSWNLFIWLFSCVFSWNWFCSLRGKVFGLYCNSFICYYRRRKCVRNVVFVSIHMFISYVFIHFFLSIDYCLTIQSRKFSLTHFRAYFYRHPKSHFSARSTPTRSTTAIPRTNQLHSRYLIIQLDYRHRRLSSSINIRLDVEHLAPASPTAPPLMRRQKTLPNKQAIKDQSNNYN